MRYQIDQSGKIEKTNRLTVICFSNRKCHTLLILAKDKQYLQKIFRKTGKPKMFIIQTFACLVYLLLKEELPKINQIIIDREYPGYEGLIKHYLLQLIRQDLRNFPSEKIEFAEIGRRSFAHLRAYQAYRSKKADRKIKAEDILGLILKLE